MFYWTRLRAVRSKLYGKVLDVGCGVGFGGRGITGAVGIERYQGIADIICSSFSNLPVRGGSFHSVALIATLNYVPDKVGMLRDIHRVLKKIGRLVITCKAKWLPHRPLGMTSKEVLALVEPCGFRLVYSEPFMLGLNRVYVFGREG